MKISTMFFWLFMVQIFIVIGIKLFDFNHSLPLIYEDFLTVWLVTAYGFSKILEEKKDV